MPKHCQWPDQPQSCKSYLQHKATIWLSKWEFVTSTLGTQISRVCPCITTASYSDTRNAERWVHDACLLKGPAIPPHHAEALMLSLFGREALILDMNTEEGFRQINWDASYCYHPISCPTGAAGEHSSQGCNASSHRSANTVHKTVV